MIVGRKNHLRKLIEKLRNSKEDEFKSDKILNKLIDVKEFKDATIVV